MSYTVQSKLFVDELVGSALKNDVAGKMVVTRCTGVPYLLDVLERQPGALAARKSISQAREALARLELKATEWLYWGPTLYLSPLTPAERGVLTRLAHGQHNPEIARALGRTVSTVNTQVSSILHKMGVCSRQHATALYWGHDSPRPYLDN